MSRISALTYKLMRYSPNIPSARWGIESGISQTLCHELGSVNRPFQGGRHNLMANSIHIFMDFISGLSKSHDKDVILVVVDRLAKYAHFIGLTQPCKIGSLSFFG